MDSLFGGCWDVIKDGESEDDVTDGGEGKREGEGHRNKMEEDGGYSISKRHREEEMSQL